MKKYSIFSIRKNVGESKNVERIEINISKQESGVIRKCWDEVQKSRVPKYPDYWPVLPKNLSANSTYYSKLYGFLKKNESSVRLLNRRDDNLHQTSTNISKIFEISKYNWLIFIVVTKIELGGGIGWGEGENSATVSLYTTRKMDLC